MNILVLIRTLYHLRPVQAVYQLRHRLFHPVFRKTKSPATVGGCCLKEFIPKSTCFENGVFRFLNVPSPFVSWNDVGHGMLWAYNLNYMDWLCQENVGFEENAGRIDKFISELHGNTVGLDAGPISLRGVNWIKFITVHASQIDDARKKSWNDSLYSQYKLLEKKLEYHLLANHLLENAFSLYIASLYFKDGKMHKKAMKLLLKELEEQILPDGAHYEQTPMYHCILLDRLLDCCNFSMCNPVFPRQEETTRALGGYATRMLGHLESLLYEDGAIPLLNDSARGVAPSPCDIFSYAKRLGLVWEAVAMNECGYRKFKGRRMEAIVDVGNVMASYQPGHSHADTFSYELRVDGKPFIVDTGISTYDKTDRRLLERSTRAHNTVTVEDHDSSEVWGGFRMGNRAKVSIIDDRKNVVEAFHDGFGVIHVRKFLMSGNLFEITDAMSSACDAKSYIHFAPGVEVLGFAPDRIVTGRAVVRIEGGTLTEVVEGRVSSEYNCSEPACIAVIHFTEKLKYAIEIEDTVSER